MGWSWWDFGESSGHDGDALATWRITCGYCNVRGKWEPINHLERKHGESEKVLNYDTFKCLNCGNLTMVFWSPATNGRLHNYKTMPWPTETTEFPDHWPEDIGRFWLQAQRNIETQNWDAAAMMARSALQLIVRYQKAAGANLKQEIDDLAAKGLLPPIVKEWAHEVRVVSNEKAAHPEPGAKGTPQKDAKDLVKFVGVLMTLLYDLPDEIRKF